LKRKGKQRTEGKRGRNEAKKKEDKARRIIIGKDKERKTRYK
jgi:hypothetical protein